MKTPASELRDEKEPARIGADKQDPHGADLAVIDHRKRGLQPIEELDHRDEAGRHIDLIQYVGLVRRDDRDAEDGPEPGREDEQPDERPDQRREETPSLAEEPQGLSPRDPGETGCVASR